MSAVIFWASLDFEKNCYSRTAPVFRRIGLPFTHKSKLLKPGSYQLLFLLQLRFLCIRLSTL